MTLISRSTHTSMPTNYPDLREPVRDLCAHFDTHYWLGAEQDGDPEAFVKALSEAGRLAALIPEQYGGAGLNLTEASVILDDGFFVELTIFSGAGSGMSLATEEIFGPVPSVLTFADEAAAVSLVNDSRYGLGAGVWIRDGQRAHRAAHAIKAGTVWVKADRAVSDNALFGGFKQSGIGRGNSPEAVHEYRDAKTVWTELTGTTRDPFTLG